MLGNPVRFCVSATLALACAAAACYYIYPLLLAGMFYRLNIQYYIAWILCETIIFFLPFLVCYIMTKRKLPSARRRTAPAALSALATGGGAGAAIAAGAAIIHMLAPGLSTPFWTMETPFGGFSGVSALSALAFAASILIPSIFRQLFFFGSMLTSFENMGSLNAIFIVSALYAALISPLEWIWLYLILGLVGAYLTLVYNSVWVSVCMMLCFQVYGLLSGLFPRLLLILGKGQGLFIIFSVVFIAGFGYVALSRLAERMSKGSLAPFIRRQGGGRRMYGAVISPPGIVYISVCVLGIILKIAR